MSKETTIFLDSYFKLPNGDTVSVYKESKHGHYVTVVTNKNNETIAVNYN